MKVFRAALDLFHSIFEQKSVKIEGLKSFYLPFDTPILLASLCSTMKGW
ncbi:hypothetical protein SAMN05421821_10774 [Mucilaginibacter lappiensis]|uniref:Uncharacterized protein n=1 Tax=Mucilaginibacter lappiensis TaxID=354630 RepID=A0ABR6PLA7_9SPHI|nr:hypothetical protein [Mucilaginibacter lappiensis]SIR41161.1 hypothetical protein SAMN05421821_10774 [Mucilaginibacter lappiensis]